MPEYRISHIRTYINVREHQTKCNQCHIPTLLDLGMTHCILACGMCLSSLLSWLKQPSTVCFTASGHVHHWTTKNRANPQHILQDGAHYKDRSEILQIVHDQLLCMTTFPSMPALTGSHFTMQPRAECYNSAYAVRHTHNLCEVPSVSITENMDFNFRDVLVWELKLPAAHLIGL